MSRVSRLFCLIIILSLAIPGVPASAEAGPAAALPASCETIEIKDPATQAVTETYLVCMPGGAGGRAWNGRLVIFAHGFVPAYPPTASPTLPLNQIITPDGKTSLPALLNSMGFAFAMTSYTKNGLAVKEGGQDILRLVEYMRVRVAPASISKIFLVGASEGGLITTQLIEKHPDVFRGGLAGCAPIGNFKKQIDYWGDFRAVYDALFPGVLPPSATVIPEALMADWVKTASSYQNQVILQMMAHLTETVALFDITKAAYDPQNRNGSSVKSALGLLTYNILATNEAQVELGGVQPFDNTGRVYAGANPQTDALVNQNVVRYALVGNVTAALAPYQTTGKLSARLITMHTVLDPIVPQWHQADYMAKVNATGSKRYYQAITLPGYGHCRFGPAQLLYGFGRIIYDGDNQAISQELAQSILVDATDFREFMALNAQFGDITRFPVYLPGVVR